AGARSGNCLASATAACERSIQLVLGTLSSRIHPPRVTSSSCQRALRVVMVPSFTSARPLAVTFSAQKPSRQTALPPPERCCTSSLVRTSSRRTSAAYLRERSRYFARRSTRTSGSALSAASAMLRWSRIVLPQPGTLRLERGHPAAVLQHENRPERRATVHDRHCGERRLPEPAVGQLVVELLRAGPEVLRQCLAHLRQHAAVQRRNVKRPQDLPDRLALGEPEQSLGCEVPHDDL